MLDRKRNKKPRDKAADQVERVLFDIDRKKETENNIKGTHGYKWNDKHPNHAQ